MSRAQRGRGQLILGIASVLLASLLAILTVATIRGPTSPTAPAVGRPAPAFALPRLARADTLRLADLAGHPVVLNFWASWCGECREEFSVLKDAWMRYRERGVVFVGVVFQDSTASAQAFLREIGADWPTVMDENARTALAFGVRGVPTTVFIRPDGWVTAVHFGRLTQAALSEQLSRMLGEQR